MSTRKLTAMEQQFVQEAESGGFCVLYDDNGCPYAMGAAGTGNLFSMDIEEQPDGDGAVYTLRQTEAA